MESIIQILFDFSTILNVGLGIWSAIEWGISYKLNHSRYRYLYLFWIAVSIIFSVIYVGITFTPINRGAVDEIPITMVAIRPAITLALSASAITAEIMRFMRTKSKLYEPK